MNDSDQFIDWQLQLTHYRDPSTKVGVLGGEIFKGKKRVKTAKTQWRPLANDWLSTE